MRTRAVIVSSVCALLAVGCGGDDPPARSVAVERLASLCESARADIEAIGLPSEVGIEVMKPWAARGKRLVGVLAAIEGTTLEERTQLEELANELGEYYAGLSLGYTTYKQTTSREMYEVIIERADAFLASADKRVIALGAPECAVRPFEDEPAS